MEEKKSELGDSPVSGKPDKTALFRSMKRTDSNLPICKQSSSGLGARIPKDIAPDADGNVRPETGGMSVTPDDWRGMLPHFLPKSSKKGIGNKPIFRIMSNQLGEDLDFRRDSRNREKHGFVEPAQAMHVEKYQVVLCDTADRWSPVMI